MNTEHIPSTDGVTIVLDHHGGDGPPLLIAHATGFCAGPYRPMIDRLTGRFDVWALDFRAHGRSSRPADGDLSWSGMADDVAAAVERIGGPVYGFGHSMGGACLLGAERRAPGTFSAIWAFEPIVIPDEFVDSEPTSNPLAASARRRRSGFASKAEALHRYAGRPPLGSFRADVLWHYVDAGFVEVDGGPAVELRCAPEDEAATFEGRGKPTSSQMADVAVPVIIGVGDHDPGPGPAMFARRAEANLPRGRLRTYPALGHFGPFQDPDAIAADVASDLLD